MMNQAARRWAMPLEGHDQRAAAELNLEVIGYGPAQDFARGHVLNRGEIEPTLIRGYVADICQPDLVGPGNGEVARQQVGRDRVIVATIGGPRCAPAALASGQALLELPNGVPRRA